MSRVVLQRLLTNLQTTHKVYARLLEVAERKKADILGNDIPALREDLQTEERLAGEGANLGMEREALHRQCCAALRVRQTCDRLEDLCRFMPAEWQPRFQKERLGLRRTLERLHEVNRANVALVNNSLQLMEGLLAALFDAEPVSAYGPHGIRTKPELSLRSLNTKA